MKPVPAKFLLHPLYCPAIGFGTGLSPKAPGTVGTILGVVFYYFLQHLAWPYYLILIVALSLFGIWCCQATAKALEVHDHSGIVWDEIVGYLITMIIAPQGWEWILLGFVIFRILDVYKPWPIRWVDKNVHGGFGIMLDDILAGILGWIIIQILAYTT